jgi:bifunctional non-homologous end joining protein LigD
MIASSAKLPFNDPNWIFETKLDGYRAIVVIDSTGKARIWSRNLLPLEQKFPTTERGLTLPRVRVALLSCRQCPLF